MKIKMFEHFQGTGQPTLLPGVEYDVDQALGAWLLEHRKAEAVELPAKPKDEELIIEPAAEPEAKTERPIPRYQREGRK